MSRPDLHTPDHTMWDQGGYCNNLVTDEDGCGEVCGYQRPTLVLGGAPALPTGSFMGEPVQQVRRDVYEIPDWILVQRGWEEVEWLEEALKTEMRRAGVSITVSRDVLRRVTIVEVHP